MIDETGLRWFPRRGDLIRDFETQRFGVVLDVKQTGNAPATVAVWLDEEGYAKREPEALERDDTLDERPGDPPREMLLIEAAALVVAELPALVALCGRAEPSSIAAILEHEARRCRVVAKTHADAQDHRAKSLEEERAAHLDELALAVRVIREATGYTP